MSVELPKEIVEGIGANVAAGGLEGITVDVETSIEYTFKKDGQVVGSFSTDVGNYTGLSYVQFALVQDAHTKGGNLITNLLNAATQLSAASKARFDRSSNVVTGPKK